MWKPQAWASTDKGLKRHNNQDSFLVDPDLGLYIVADGMGGHKGGEIASNMAIEIMEEFLSEHQSSDYSIPDLLKSAYDLASAEIHSKAQKESDQLSGMGTTMVTAFCHGDHLYIANVGDSRAYLFHRPFLWQLTEDHSLINEQIRAGILSEKDEDTQQGKNIITRSVGYEPQVHADVIERIIQVHDVILLCSDGLSGMVSDTEITHILNNNPPAKWVDLLIQRALEAGGIDNVTALVLYFSV